MTAALAKAPLHLARQPTAEAEHGQQAVAAVAEPIVRRMAPLRSGPDLAGMRTPIPSISLDTFGIYELPEAR